MHTCLCVRLQDMYVNTDIYPGQKRATAPLKLELQAVKNCLSNMVSGNSFKNRMYS